MLKGRDCISGRRHGLVKVIKPGKNFECLKVCEKASVPGTQ